MGSTVFKAFLPPVYIVFRAYLDNIQDAGTLFYPISRIKVKHQVSFYDFSAQFRDNGFYIRIFTDINRFAYFKMLFTFIGANS